MNRTLYIYTYVYVCIYISGFSLSLHWKRALWVVKNLSYFIKGAFVIIKGKNVVDMTVDSSMSISFQTTDLSQ